jgi:hypothetical protein
MLKAKAAIGKAGEAQQLKKFRSVCEQRRDDGFYTVGQAGELLEMIEERLGMMLEGKS